MRLQKKMSDNHGETDNFIPNTGQYKSIQSSLVAQTVRNLPAMQETQVPSLVGKIPWRREWQPIPVFLPGEFHGQTIGSQRTGHDWVTNTFHRYTCAPSILNCSPTCLPTLSLQVVPEHRFEYPVSCIKLPLVICFTYGNIYVSMLSSKIILPLPSPTKSKCLLLCSFEMKEQWNKYVKY